VTLNKISEFQGTSATTPGQHAKVLRETESIIKRINPWSSSEWAPDPLMVGIRSPDGLVVGLAPATLEFWVR